jgi:hypothetical protein
LNVLQPHVSDTPPGASLLFFHESPVVKMSYQSPGLKHI